VRLLRPHPLRWVVLAGALATLTALATAGDGTHAAFTDAQSVDFTVSAGSVALEHVGDGLGFTSAPLAPGGEPARGTVRVRNGGTLAADVAFLRTAGPVTSPAGCAVRDALRLRVVADADGDPDTKGDRVEIVDGPMASVTSAALGRLAAGGERSFDVAVWLLAQHGATADDNDNCFQGSVDTERFAFTAMEARP
jgi:hypothetical protein